MDNLSALSLSNSSIEESESREKKKIVFLTGTRADFSKLKSLISITQNSILFDIHVFVTGMHMNPLYGLTVDEVYKSGVKNIHPFINHETIEHMDRTLARTINGFSEYIRDLAPDLIVVHGDRVEALAGAIVGSLNNIRVAHIEGGEISGTIDEHIRHSVSKMAHIHLVANEDAKKVLIQLGEHESSIFIIGSPDLDLMAPNTLPSLNIVKAHYEIHFEEYAVVIYHPVTTENSNAKMNAEIFVNSLLSTQDNYVVIYPNNDLGSIEIMNEYRRLENNTRFKIFPSLRFEYFLSLLNNASYIIGNSSAGIREAAYYGVPAVNVGSRQNGRSRNKSIFDCEMGEAKISDTINIAKASKLNHNSDHNYYGKGHSDNLFFELLKTDKLWTVNYQKVFQERSL